MSHGPMTQTTTMQALMSLLKAYVGSGILSMPKAFSDSGYVFGCLGTALIGFLCNSSVHMLVDINQLHMDHPDQPPYDFEELAQIAFEYGPKKYRKYGKLSRTILTICLCLTQLGFCCAYALFIAKNLLKFVINLKLGDWNEDDIVYFILILLPVMILLNFIRSIRHLAIGSMIANVIQLTSLSIIIYNLVTDVPSIKDRLPVNDKIPQFVSTTVFTFEGITVTMPLYRSMKNRKSFAKPFGVINMAICFVIILYSSIGFLGYLKYGEDVKASITLSLPNEPLYSAVQLMYAIAITFSYPLQLYVAINIIWPSIRDFLINRKKSEQFINISEYVCRALMVTLTFLLAASIPELDLVIELIGAFSCSSVALIIPPIMHLVAFTDRKSGYPKLWLYIKDLTILFLGIFAFVFGTYFALQGIVERFNEKAHLLVDDDNLSLLPNIIQPSPSTLWFEKLLNITTANMTTTATQLNDTNSTQFINFIH